MCARCRPPVQGEIDSIRSLRREWEELQGDALETVIIGYLNIHHKKWLKWSARNTAEGEELHKFCTDVGLHQLPSHPPQLSAANILEDLRKVGRGGLFFGLYSLDLMDQSIKTSDETSPKY